MLYLLKIWHLEDALCSRSLMDDASCNWSVWTAIDIGNREPRSVLYSVHMVTGTILISLSPPTRVPSSYHFRCLNTNMHARSLSWAGHSYHACDESLHRWSSASRQTQLKLNFMRLSWTVYLHRRRRLYLERLSCYGHYCIRRRICTQRALDGFCSSPTHLSTAQLSSSSGVPKLQWKWVLISLGTMHSSRVVRESSNPSTHIGTIALIDTLPIYNALLDEWHTFIFVNVTDYCKA